MRPMRLADLITAFSQNSNTQSESLIKRLFKKPILLDEFYEDEDDDEVKFQQMEATSITSVNIIKFAFQYSEDVEGDKIVSQQASLNKASLEQVNKKSIIKSSQAFEKKQLCQQALFRRFSFQALVEDMLNGKKTKLLRLNSMIFEPFRYFFVWQGYLQQQARNHPQIYLKNPCVILLRMIYDAQNYQFAKWCSGEKQEIIRKIFKMKSQKYYCQRLVKNSLQASESTLFRDQKRQLYHDLKERKMGEEIIDQDMRFLINYIQQMEEVYFDIYK